MNSNQETYFWNIFSKKGYTELNRDLGISFQISEINFQELKPFFENDFILYHQNITSFTIAKSSKKLIDELIDVYNLKLNNVTLYGLSAILQKDYINYHDIPINTSSGEWDDIEYFNVELHKLFYFIEMQLKNQSLASFNDITVNFGEKTEFKSVFIFKEIFDSLIHFYKINLENFEDVKSEKLAQIANIRLDKLPEYHKLKYIQGLFKLVTSDGSLKNITNNNLRFIGCFLLLSQIPVNSLANELTVPNNPKDIHISDINNIRNYLNGTKKISHKIEIKNI